MNKQRSVILAFILGTVFALSLAFLLPKNPKDYVNRDLFKGKTESETHEKILAARDEAIQRAIEAGEYRCCIEPPCTMCYMEANEWNNHEAGTCACDDLIAQGKEPCPQCKNGMCSDTKEDTCEIDLNL